MGMITEITGDIFNAPANSVLIRKIHLHPCLVHALADFFKMHAIPKESGAKVLF